MASEVARKFIVRRQKASVAQERRIATEMAGRRQSASGSLPGAKGDVKSDRWLIEAKMTKGARFSLTLVIWRKIWSEALRAAKLPAMQIDLAGRKVAVIDWDDFLALKDHV